MPKSRGRKPRKPKKRKKIKPRGLINQIAHEIVSFALKVQDKEDAIVAMVEARDTRSPLRDRRAILRRSNRFAHTEGRRPRDDD